RTYLFTLFTLALLMFASGCAISDYYGYSAHQTQTESKLWGTDIAFLTGDPTLDGTYAYTVKYAFKHGDATGLKYGIDINTYRNPVFAAFRRDGCVDADGDNSKGP